MEVVDILYSILFLNIRTENIETCFILTNMTYQTDDTWMDLLGAASEFVWNTNSLCNLVLYTKAEKVT